MNIIEIKRIIDSIDIEGINISSVSSYGSHTGTYYEVSNKDELYTILNKLKKIDFLEKDVTEISNLIFTENLLISEKYKFVESELYNIKNILIGFTKYFDSLSTPEYENYIKIKLPPLSTFEEFSKILNEFKIAISVPLAVCEGDNDFKLTSVEPGSMWIVGYGSKLALEFMAKITYAALKLQEMYLDNKRNEAYLQKLNIDIEHDEYLKNKQKELVDKLVETHTKEIVEKYYDSNENIEKTNLLTNSIKVLQGLIDKGAEIHPYLPSKSNSETNNNIFPDYKELFVNTTELKKIEEKK